MSDLLEQRIAALLHDETASLSLQVSAERVRRRYEERRRQRFIRRAALVGMAAALAVVAMGAFVVNDRNQVAATATPRTTPNTTAASTHVVTPVKAPGTGSISIWDESNGETEVQAVRVNLAVTCTWTDEEHGTTEIAPYTGTLYGETVTITILPDGDGGIDRAAGLPRYRASGTTGDTLDANWRAGTANMPLTIDTGVQPFAAHSANLHATYAWDCGLAPAGVPLVEKPGTSLGTATIQLTTPAAAPVSTDIRCLWEDTHTVTIDVPRLVPFGGEVVTLQLGGRYDSFPYFQIVREAAGFATYSTAFANYSGDKPWIPAGTLRFHDLVPDPESYPIGQPLPSGWTTPLGGRAEYANLTGTVTWNCGRTPADVPTPAPSTSPEPPSSGPLPSNPIPVATLGSTAGTGSGQWECGLIWRDAQGTPLAGEAGCAYLWFVPDGTATAKAGALLRVSLPGYALGGYPVTFAATDDVRRWRGGKPDTARQTQSSAEAAGTVTFYAPDAGDWVIEVRIQGTDASGNTISGFVLFHVIVTA